MSNPAGYLPPEMTITISTHGVDPNDPPVIALDLPDEPMNASEAQSLGSALSTIGAALNGLVVS